MMRGRETTEGRIPTGGRVLGVAVRLLAVLAMLAGIAAAPAVTAASEASGGGSQAASSETTPPPATLPEPLADVQPPADPAPSTTPAPSAAPDPSEPPAPSDGPEPTAPPDPTAAPEESAVPEPSVAPDPSVAPEPSVSPEPSVVPEPSIAPDPSVVPEPEPSGEAEPSLEPEPTGEPAASPDLGSDDPTASEEDEADAEPASAAPIDKTGGGVPKLDPERPAPNNYGIPRRTSMPGSSTATAATVSGTGTQSVSAETADPVEMPAAPRRARSAPPIATSPPVQGLFGVKGGPSSPEEAAILTTGVVVVVPRVTSTVSVAVDFARLSAGWAGPLVFNVWLRRQIRERRVSQRQLAMMSGVHHSTISRLLSDNRTPSLETAAKLVHALRLEWTDEQVATYFDLLPERTLFPTQRVESALRGDNELDDNDVRGIMDHYLAVRRSRRRQQVRQPVGPGP